MSSALSLSFAIHEDGTDLMHQMRNYLFFHMPPLVIAFSGRCQMLPFANEGHMFPQRKAWQAVGWGFRDAGGVLMSLQPVRVFFFSVTVLFLISGFFLIPFSWSRFFLLLKQTLIKNYSRCEALLTNASMLQPRMNRLMCLVLFHFSSGRAQQTKALANLTGLPGASK